MKITPNWKRVSLSLLLVTIALTSYLTYRVYSTPSGQTWSVEGGGFCSGMYALYNNTVDNKLYAMNCNTGVNDCNGTDLGAVFSCARNLMGNTTQGFGQVTLRAGYFAVVTPLILCPSCSAAGSRVWLGLSITGSDRGWNPATAYFLGYCANGLALQPTCGTTLIAKTASMTMMELTPNSPSVTCTSAGCTGGGSASGYHVSNLAFIQNGLATNGMSMAVGWAGTYYPNDYSFVDHIYFSPGNVASGGFTTALNMDGSEDSYVSYVIFNGGGSASSYADTTDMQWRSPLGNVNVDHSVFGGKLNLLVSAQDIHFDMDTISSIQISFTPTTATNSLFVSDSYLANAGSAAGILQANGQTISVAAFDKDIIAISTSVTMFSGAGTIGNAVFTSNSWGFPSGASNWNPGAITFTKSTSDGGNHIYVNSGNIPTGFPFVITSSNF